GGRVARRRRAARGPGESGRAESRELLEARGPREGENVKSQGSAPAGDKAGAGEKGRDTGRLMARPMYEGAKEGALSHPAARVVASDIVKQYNVILGHAQKAATPPETLRSLEPLDSGRSPTYADFQVLLGQVVAALQETAR